MHLDLTPDGNNFLIEYETRDADKLSFVGGLRRSGSFFVADKSLAIAFQLRELFGDKMTLSPRVEEWSVEQWNRYDLGADEIISDAAFYHQREGAAFLRQINRGLLSHSPGTGKTLTTLLALKEVGKGDLPALVICPNSLKLTWKKEIEKWNSDLRTVVLEGTISKKEKLLAQDADVFIINYEALATFSIVGKYGSLKVEGKSSALNEKGFVTIICDEAHRIINPKSKQSRCVKELSRGKQVKNRWLLTGTPVSNKPDDFWSLLNFMDPFVWTSKSKFIDMFCETRHAFWGGLEIIGVRTDRKDLMSRIVNLYMHHVNKEDVLPDLPEKVHTYRYIEMKPKQKKQYEALKKDMITQTEDGNYIITTDPLTCLARLSQASDATLEMLPTDDGRGEVVLETPSNKVDTILEIAAEMGGESFVVVAPSKKLIYLCAEALRKKGYKLGLFTGDQDIEERQYNIEVFQEGHIQIIMGTIGAIKEGVTLTAASTLVFLNSGWSNIDYTQCENRVHRIGSKGNRVNIINVISTGSVQEAQIAALGKKDKFLQELLGSKQRCAEFVMGE